MTSRTLALLGWVLVSTTGCSPTEEDEAQQTGPGTVDEDPPQPEMPPDSSATEFRFYASLANGELPSGSFALDDLYANASGSLNVQPGNYYVHVHYELCHPSFFDTYFPQESPTECRTFRVGPAGQIVEGPPLVDANGDSCPHVVAVDTTSENSGGLTLQVMPFEVERWACGPLGLYVIPEGFFWFDADVARRYSVNVQWPYVLKCGDAIVDGEEECDDGNFNDGDGCAFDCTLETPLVVCGDGQTAGAEQCDDGNTTDGDGCSMNCTVEQPAPICGNGVQEAGEACDDGNANHNDGCSPSCQIEFLCCCGNGVCEPGEDCDDGNHDDGDGCSSTCQFE